jgi:hypothetical protein
VESRAAPHRFTALIAESFFFDDIISAAVSVFGVPALKSLARQHQSDDFPGRSRVAGGSTTVSPAISARGAVFWLDDDSI